MTCPRGLKVASMFAVLALAVASSASAGPITYTSTAQVLQPGDPQVVLSGGGFLTPQNSPVDLTSVQVGTATLTTSNGPTFDYTGMNDPIKVNISVVLKTSSGSGSILIGGILTGLLTDLGNPNEPKDPTKPQDLTNLFDSLGSAGSDTNSFQINSGSVTIGDDVYTLRIGGFPRQFDFTIDPNSNNTVANAPIFGSIEITHLDRDPTAVPEPSTVVAMLIGGLMTGSYVRSRRRKATAA